MELPSRGIGGQLTGLGVRERGRRHTLPFLTTSCSSPSSISISSVHVRPVRLRAALVRADRGRTPGRVSNVWGERGARRPAPLPLFHSRPPAIARAWDTGRGTHRPLRGRPRVVSPPAADRGRPAKRPVGMPSGFGGRGGHACLRATSNSHSPAALSISPYLFTLAATPPKWPPSGPACPSTA